jgi:transposase-like protein
MSSDRERGEAARERIRASVRSLHLGELEAAGEARRAALRCADEELERVAQLLPDALQAGLSVTEIARTTGVSRPTLYELRGRYGASGGDLQLAVLQTVATRGPVTEPGLLKHLSPRPKTEVAAVLKSLVEDRLIEVEPSREEDPRPEYFVTPEGYERLDRWFEFDAEAEMPES